MILRKETETKLREKAITILKNSNIRMNDTP